MLQPLCPLRDALPRLNGIRFLPDQDPQLKAWGRGANTSAPRLEWPLSGRTFLVRDKRGQTGGGVGELFLIVLTSGLVFGFVGSLIAKNKGIVQSTGFLLGFFLVQ